MREKGFLLADLLLGAAAVTLGSLAFFRVTTASTRAVARARETVVAGALLDAALTAERRAHLAAATTPPVPGTPVVRTTVVTGNHIDYRIDITKEVVPSCDGLEHWTCVVRRDVTPPGGIPRPLVRLHTGAWRPW